MENRETQIDIEELSSDYDTIVEQSWIDEPYHSTPSLKDKAKIWLASHKCYSITLVFILTFALSIGFAPGALDLNNMADYSDGITFKNQYQVQLSILPSLDNFNSTFLLVDPVINVYNVDVTASITSIDKGSNETWITADVTIEAQWNVSTSQLEEFYSNSSLIIQPTLVKLQSTEVDEGTLYKSWQAWLTLIVICGCLALLLQEDAISPDVVLTGALVILTLGQVITVKEALAGFANEGIATIGSLYIVALSVSRSGALDILSKHILGSPTHIAIALIRLMLPIAFLSAFINNTPIVAMMAPVVISWSHRVNIPTSKLLIPLSYAAILGGTVTLIGTSTNLIVQALLADADPSVELTLFGLSPVGIPTAILGILYIIFIGHRILPTRESPGQELKNSPKSYSAHVIVRNDADSLIGKTLENAGLRHLTGLFVYSIERPSKGETFDAPSGQFVLEAGDIIGVAGDVSHVSRLWTTEGLELHVESDVRKLHLSSGKHHLAEVVVAPHTSLIGKTPKTLKFRSRFNAAIVGIHRGGEQVATRIGDVVLQAGDVLLLVTAGEDFIKLHGHSTFFSLVSEIGIASIPMKVSKKKIGFVTLLAGVMVILASIEDLDLSLFTLALVVSYIFWLTGLITVEDARASVDIGVIAMVASSIGLASAIENSGLALRIGTCLVQLFEPIGELGLLFGIYIATTVLNAFVSNSASVSLIFPIAYVIATQSQVLNVRMICYILMLAGSADFSTPIGYQTNLMVYSLGNYRFVDYIKVGLPLQLLCCTVGCLIGYYVYQE